MRRILVLPAVAFLAGTQLPGLGLASPTLAGLGIATAGLLVLGLATAVRDRCGAVALAAAAGLACVLAGSLRALPPRGLDSIASMRERGQLGALTELPVRVVGRVVGLVQSRTSRTSTVALVDLELEAVSTGRLDLPLRGRIRLTCDESLRPTLRGAGRIEAWARLRDPRRPCIAPRGEPRHGQLSGRLTAPSLARVLGPPDALRALRERSAAGLEQAFGERRRGAALARALALGEDDALDEAFVRGLRAAGTVHVLSVSGLHVALVAAAAGWGARMLGAGARGAALVSLVAAWQFAALAGFGVPVLRTCFLASLLGVARLLGRSLDPWNALAAAALGSALLAPEEALGLSFNLTFGAAGSLVLLAPRIAEMLPASEHRLGHELRVGLAASFAAVLGLVPAAAVFHQIPCAAPVTNLIAVPIAGLATAASLLAAAAGAITPLLARPPAWIVSASAGALDALEPLGRWGELRVASPAPGVLACYVLALAAWAVAADPRARGVGATLVLATSCVMAWPARGPALPPGVDARLLVIDVGQGSSALVEVAAPGGRVWRALVDAAGPRAPGFDPGERLVAAALWRRGIRRLDAVVVSHADADHRGGAPAVIRLFRPKHVVLPPGSLHRPRDWGDVLEACAEVGLPVELAARGTRLGPASGEAWLDVDWPPRRPADRAGLSENDASLVLALVRQGRRLALLPGDIEARAEARLAPDPGPVPVLVAAHHGSRTSSSPRFVAGLAPLVAAVSAGARNPFGHPHPEVVDRLRASGAVVLATGADGSVEATFSTRFMRVTCCGSGRERVAGLVSSQGDAPIP